METKTKRKGRRKAWQVSSTINPNGSICVFSLVYSPRECYLKSKTFYGYSQKEARLMFIEETINEGLKLAPVR